MIFRFTKDNKIDLSKKELVEFVRSKYPTMPIPQGDNLKVVVNAHNGNIELTWTDEGSVNGG